LAARILKEAIDRVCAVVLIVIISPLLLVISLFIILLNGLPIIFSHNRVGKNNKVFKFYKFRTMKNTVSANNDTIKDEDRITKLGRFLRRTSLDELPSLFNLLKGDISLVGPRPLLEKYLTRYNSFQARRHEVKPGITGLAQVNGRNLISWDEKFEYDVFYVDNQSLRLDFKILLLTIVKVFKRSGISPESGEVMPEFTGNEQESK